MPEKKYIQDFDLIKNFIVYRLINTDKNERLLEDIPHINFLDLSIVFHCLTKQTMFCTKYNLIRNVHFQQWNVSLDRLYEAANKNTQKILGYEMRSMRSMMCEMMRENPEKFDSELLDRLENSIPMYVVSNKSRTEGASCMLYPKLIEDFAEALGENIYIIPSSINELILLPAINDNAGIYFKNSIREVNDTNMKLEEILSYSLYYYDRGMNRIMIY